MVNFILNRHIEKLQQFNRQRGVWIRLSILVVIIVSIILLDYFLKDTSHFHYFLISSGFIIAVIWWYWTMQVVKEIINHKYYETELLKMLIADIRDIKKSVHQNMSIDKHIKDTYN